jgi:two-component system cell cycle sensor histidine kinase/response regulator CckA
VDVKTILLVVADAARRVALGDALRLESHSVLIAETSDEAVSVVRSTTRPADLIVTDQRLDQGAGRTLAALVGQARPGARVLFLTGFAPFSAQLPIYFLERDASPESVARVASRIVAKT